MSASRLRASLALLSRAASRWRLEQQQWLPRAPPIAAAASARPLHAPPVWRSFASSSSSSVEAKTTATTTSEDKHHEDYSHLPGYTLAQVARRDGITAEEDGSPPRSWLAIDGLVYDATPYLDEHPGGSDAIVLNAGTDASEEFKAVHTPAAREVLRRFLIGRLVAQQEEEEVGATAVAATEAATTTTTATTGPALDPRKRVPLPLVSRRWVSPTSVLLRFALPGGSKQRAGLPTGQHVMVYFRDEKAAAGGEAAGGEAAGGELVARAYTPVSRDDDARGGGGGTLDLLVRVYRPNERFPNGGRMSQLLADAVPLEGEWGLAGGERPPPPVRVEFKGPVGHFRYLGNGGRFSLADAPPRRASRLLLVAGGSGITPCYNLVRAVLLEEPEAAMAESGGAGDPAPRVALVYGSPCPEEILLKEELDDLARRFPSPAFELHYTVDKVPGGAEAEKEWRDKGGGVGFVTREMLEEHGFLGGAEAGEDGERLALVCGPPVMLEKAVVPALKAMGYEGDRLVAF